MNNKRRISVEFESKKYPLLIKNSDEEEKYYRDARLKLQEKVLKYKSRYSKIPELNTADFYVMASFQYALESLFNDSFIDKIRQLTVEIDQYLQEE